MFSLDCVGGGLAVTFIGDPNTFTVWGTRNLSFGELIFLFLICFCRYNGAGWMMDLPSQNGKRGKSGSFNTLDLATWADGS